MVCTFTRSNAIAFSEDWELYVQQRNIEFQEGLAQQLSQHLLDTYGKAPEGGVRFVRNLVDQAFVLV